MSKKIFITWEEINTMLESIYEQSKGSVKYVTGIPRGGSVLAILFSHRFNIEYLEYRSNHYPDLLIFDDIADTGNTLSILKETVTLPKTATLHYKESSIIKPDYFAQKISEDFGWIVYPWEKEDSKSIQDYLVK